MQFSLSPDETKLFAQNAFGLFGAALRFVSQRFLCNGTHNIDI
jgi:hypothetical protein